MPTTFAGISLNEGKRGRWGGVAASQVVGGSAFAGALLGEGGRGRWAGAAAATASDPALAGRLSGVLFGATYPQGQPGVDWLSAPDLSGPLQPGSGVEMIFGTSGFPITAAQTIYIGVLVDVNRVAAEIPIPSVSLTEFHISASMAPGVGQSFTYTVLRNGAPTAMSVQVAGASTSNFLSGQSVAFSAGDRFVVKVETSASAAEAYHSFGIKAI